MVTEPTTWTMRIDAAHAAELGQPENAAGHAAPEAAKAVQRPDAEHVVDLEALLGIGEAHRRR